MSLHKSARKEDFIKLLQELDVPLSGNETVLQLKTELEQCKTYKEDKEFVINLLNSIVEERKNTETQNLELEKIKLARIEKEIELQNLKSQNAQLSDNSDHKVETNPSNNLEHLIKSVRTLTIPVPAKSENFNLFFTTLERAFVTKSVPDDCKAEILINILGDKAANILYYIDEKDLKCYEKIKTLVLKEFQPSAAECLHIFRRARRAPNETYIQFATRLNANFRHYLQLRNVSDFESLCDLIVSDQFFLTLDRQTSSHISITQGEGWFKPKELAQHCDIYFGSTGKFINDSPLYKIQSDAIFEKRLTNHYTPKFQSYPPKEQSRKFNSHQNKDHDNYSKVKCLKCLSYGHEQRKCVNSIVCLSCGFPGHKASQCDKRVKKEIKSEATVNKIASDSRPSFLHELQYADILLDNVPVKALIDSGSALLVVRKRLVPPRKETFSQITLTSCFKENKTANLAKFMLSLKGSQPIETIGAICEDLTCDLILPPSIYEILRANSKQTEISPTFPPQSAPVVLNEERSHPANVNNSPSLRENEYQMFDSFLVNVSNVIEECCYDLSHISDPVLRNKINELITNYRPNKTESTNLKMSIILTDDVPVCQRSRRLAFSEKQEVEKQIEQWLQEGIIEHSCSAYSSPLVVCRKKNGDMRLCVDYRKLNKKTVKDKYPLPIIEEVLDNLSNSKVFTTLDLKNAFFHVEVEEHSRKYTSFRTDTHQFQFVKVPFGLTNSPSTFQRYVNTVFRDLLKDGTVIIYLDDIIIPAENENESFDKLTRVLQTASKYGLELNLKKCQFMKREIAFLGHIITNGTIRPSAEKTRAVQQFPEPKNAKQVQSFLGLTGYFRKYIRSYATIARPLSDLLRASTPFKFEHEQKAAFQKLKDILCNEPVLHLFKQGAKLELHTDASKLGFGAILMQQSDDGLFYPIHFMSRKTSVQEEKYCSYELEVLAIIEAMKKFRNYLIGNKFKIYTDCAAFTKTLDKKDVTPKIARWTLFLQEFEFEVVHRPGKQMQHVDALSRYPVTLLTTDDLTHKIITAQESDEYIKTMKTLLQQGQNSAYVLKNDVLYKIVNDQEVLVVPEILQVEVVKKSHSLGHFSIAKTEELVKRDYYFPNMKKCIENVVHSCIECILVNKKRGKGEGFLNPISKENVPLSTYHIDFIGPMPTTNKNYNHIFSVIDGFTKFSWLYPVKSTSSNDAIQKLKQQQAIFGNPVRIISDRGSAFTSKEFQDYCETEGIEHVTITTGVPRGNGQIERLHGTILPVLSKLAIDEPNKWYKHVDALQRTINSTTSRSTKRTPFELLTGVQMRRKEDKRILEILEEERINSMMDHLHTIREEAKGNILKIQEESRKCYNKKRKKAHVYKKDDLVAIRRTQFGTGMKLRAKFLGPYKVVRVKSNDRYDVEKVGDHEGPNKTSTSVDNMKLWDSN